MSSSVSISIATNSAIAAAKGFGWLVTGSPTLFAETVHSLADVGNQVLLKIGEVRGRGGPDADHPFGRGQEIGGSRGVRDNRLIGTSDRKLDAAAQRSLEGQGIVAQVRSLVLDNDRAVVFVRATREVPQSYAVGEALKAYVADEHGKPVDAVYWKFATTT